MTGKVVSDGIQKIDRWKRSIEAVKDARKVLNRAEVEANNATNALGKWLLPHDAKPEEKFSVWHDSELIEVTAPANKNDFTNLKVTIRK